MSKSGADTKLNCSLHGIMYGYCSECIRTGVHGVVTELREEAIPPTPTTKCEHCGGPHETPPPYQPATNLSAKPDAVPSQTAKTCCDKGSACEGHNAQSVPVAAKHRDEICYECGHNFTFAASRESESQQEIARLRAEVQTPTTSILEDMALACGDFMLLRHKYQFERLDGSPLKYADTLLLGGVLRRISESLIAYESKPKGRTWRSLVGL